MGDSNCSDQTAYPFGFREAATTLRYCSSRLSCCICRSGDNPPGYASGDMPASNDRHDCRPASDCASALNGLCTIAARSCIQDA